MADARPPSLFARNRQRLVRNAASATDAGIRVLGRKSLFDSVDETNAFLERQNVCPAFQDHVTSLDPLEYLEAYVPAEESPRTCLVLFADTSDFRSTIFGGVPSVLTDLCQRSSLISQLDQPPFAGIELYTNTLFYLPRVEVNARPVRLMLMSSAEHSMAFFEAQQTEVDEHCLRKVMQTKIITPLLTALKHRPQFPVDRIIVGDLDVRHRVVGVNTQLSHVIGDARDELACCFPEVVWCCAASSTRRHLRQYLERAP